ncbi:hypothetical protein [Metabacillus litoralis]|jgi:RNA polymerase sigma-70 factor, ECF subfamily|nr:hypothetical protein [Metabacillus litoralis]
MEKMESFYSLDSEGKLVLFQAIEQLDEKYKTFVVLRYYKDLSVKQI